MFRRNLVDEFAKLKAKLQAGIIIAIGTGTTTVTSLTQLCWYFGLFATTGDILSFLEHWNHDYSTRKLSQQQHLSRIQLGHSNGDWLTLQSSILHIQSAHLKLKILSVNNIKFF